MEPLAVLLMLIELASIALEVREELISRAVNDTIIGAGESWFVAKPD